MKINKYKFLVSIICILFLFFGASCGKNRNKKDMKLYTLSKNYKSITLAYWNIKLSQEQILSLQEVINDRSFEEYENKSFVGLCSNFIILNCNDREVYIRLSDCAWSFWDKEKTIIKQYKKREPIWRKYKHPNSTKTIFYKFFYNMKKIKKRVGPGSVHLPLGRLGRARSGSLKNK